jgi:hypothetical protein
MASYPRLMLRFAAAIGIASLLWIAAPAVASDGAVTGSGTAVTTATSPPVDIKRRASHRIRFVASHQVRRDRRVGSIRDDGGCSGVWCGRQLVLMIGIGY